MKLGSDQPIARLPMLMGGVAWACILGGPVGFFTSNLFGESPEAFGTSRSAAVGVLPVALGAVIGLMVLTPPAMRSMARLGVGVIVASSMRMLFALALGGVFHFILKPTPLAFWAALLGASLACLVVDVIWSTRAIRRATHTTKATTA